MSLTVSCQLSSHPLLLAAGFVTDFPAPLSDLAVPAAWLPYFSADAQAPVARSEALRVAVRELLRAGGYKPTGRGKPSSEYLLRAASDGTLGSINLAVDACNIVSLHCGLPISVVDFDRATPPFRIDIAPPNTSYEFNSSGQEIAVEGLLCFSDATGPCANAVKDSQRTKTHAGTRRTLSIIWGVRAFPDATRQAVDWYRELLTSVGCVSEPMRIENE
ncbi:MAG: phenylalanine--tRNA ligase beta subunit-related protein [Planctomycetota bacterium]